ncbi:hypothetical protein RHGRI_031173 [Rhododendron griersonianum]|uniref:Uncharacterized protein n=1 Tax=Rhododendron griersonianum TaxID=479676 RepID=A0AAV6I6V4_9ERIC|nr:hypothetical protein RHGRI_031173 [Rhododendron griersonianum]
MHVVLAGSIIPTTSSLLSLPNVFYVPHLSLGLVSISQLSDSGFDILFSSSGSVVQDRVSKKQIGTGRRVGDLYVLESLHVPMESTSTALSSFRLDEKSSPFYLWHSRLDLVHIDPFPSEVPYEEYISTINVSDLPVASSAPSRSTLIPPFPYAYSRNRRHAVSPAPPPSSIDPPTASLDPGPSEPRKDYAKLSSALELVCKCQCPITPPPEFLIPVGYHIFNPTGEFGMTRLAKGLLGYDKPTPYAGVP